MSQVTYFFNPLSFPTSIYQIKILLDLFTFEFQFFTLKIVIRKLALQGYYKN